MKEAAWSYSCYEVPSFTLSPSFSLLHVPIQTPARSYLQCFPRLLSPAAQPTAVLQSQGSLVPVTLQSSSLMFQLVSCLSATP